MAIVPTISDTDSLSFNHTTINQFNYQFSWRLMVGLQMIRLLPPYPLFHLLLPSSMSIYMENAARLPKFRCSIERLACYRLDEFVEATPDPLIAITKHTRGRSRNFWRNLGKKLGSILLCCCYCGCCKTKSNCRCCPSANCCCCFGSTQQKKTRISGHCKCPEINCSCNPSCPKCSFSCCCCNPCSCFY
uniref:Uncharacterized protein n=1 Tax=Lactuca sativa TaxID=4236 RepID=A0A9R1VQV0_LACSA|nr:hypothetical protein LSAT_V11C400194210 [Lactuca sativa]